MSRKVPNFSVFFFIIVSVMHFVAERRRSPRRRSASPAPRAASDDCNVSPARPIRSVRIGQARPQWQMPPRSEPPPPPPPRAVAEPRAARAGLAGRHRAGKRPSRGFSVGMAPPGLRVEMAGGLHAAAALQSIRVSLEPCGPSPRPCLSAASGPAPPHRLHDNGRRNVPAGGSQRRHVPGHGVEHAPSSRGTPRPAAGRRRPGGPARRVGVAGHPAHVRRRGRRQAAATRQPKFRRCRNRRRGRLASLLAAGAADAADGCGGSGGGGGWQRRGRPAPLAAAAAAAPLMRLMVSGDLTARSSD